MQLPFVVIKIQLLQQENSGRVTASYFKICEGERDPSPNNWIDSPYAAVS